MFIAGMGLLSLQISGAVFVRGCMYMLHQKAMPRVTQMTNQLHAHGCGRTFAVFSVCSRGLVGAGFGWRQCHHRCEEIFVHLMYPCEGHPPPRTFAMQTRHVFLYFLITNMVYLQTVGENLGFQA